MEGEAYEREDHIEKRKRLQMKGRGMDRVHSATRVLYYNSQ